MKVDVKKASESRVVLIHGDEPVLRKRALQDVMEATGVDEFDREVFLGDQATPSQWLSSVGTTPFLAERRVVVVRNVLRAKDIPAGFEKELANLPPTALLLLVADDETSADEERSSRFATAERAWKTAVEKGGGKVLTCSFGDAKALPAVLRTEAKALGKQLSNVAAETLSEMCGANYGAATEELQKLVLYVGDQEEIREPDIKAVVTPSREWNVFKLCDAVVAGQPGQAIRQLKLLLGGSGKIEDAAHRNIIPQLSRNFKLLWQARQCLDTKSNPLEPPHALSEYWPQKPNLASESPWLRKRVAESAKKVTTPGVERCLRELATADATLKGLIPGFNANETMETLLVQCCRLIRQ